MTQGGDDFIPFLRNVYFFKDLDEDVLDRISRLCHAEDRQAGEVLFEEGDPADKFYMIMDGAVEVWKESLQGTKDLLAVHGKGHLFGEMALIDELPRSAAVVVKDDVRLITVNRDDFQRIIRENSGVALSILRSVSSMVRKSNDTYVDQLQKRNIELERTNRELRETQKELLRSERLSTLGKFSSMILHDIRNPISVLKGYAQMITMKPEAEKTESYAEKIVNEAERLNRLAGELLDYSRGEIRLNLSVVKVEDLLEEVAGLIGDNCRMRGIEISVEAAGDASLLLDRERMVRSLLNISDNARKAMRRGGRLSLRGFRREEQDQLIIEVGDTGVGMSREVQDQIFEPFFSSSERGGTGLGMVIVKSVVEAHEGRLEIESEPGEGTLVRIVMPFRG